MVPGGVRVGSNSLTSRSMKEPEMEIVADFLHRAVQIGLKAQEEAGSKLLKDFISTITERDGESRKMLRQLTADVQEFAMKFPLPGVPVRPSRPLVCVARADLIRARRTRPRSSTSRPERRSPSPSPPRPFFLL
mgnify:CR=1 FL=1